jgi:hypothetical protein
MSAERPVRPAVKARPADRDREDDPRPAGRPAAGPDARTYLYSGLTLFAANTAALVVGVVVLLAGVWLFADWQLDRMKTRAAEDAVRQKEEYNRKVEEMRAGFKK